MQLKTPELEIPLDDPFKNDLLGRKSSAEMLTELIHSTNEALVLCINASWGEGKTTFLAMWRQMLKNRGVKSLNFNAWENDFADDAFVSLIAELELGIESLELNAKDKSAAEKQFNKAKKIGTSLIKRSIPTALKIATAGLVNFDELSEDALAQFSEKLAEEQIQRYENSKKSVAGFKQELETFAAKIVPSVEGAQKTPLVIFIDELDRCRPIYAIKILEAVKHFFSVPNVVFVLALDRLQLGHSIRQCYGAGMDVSGYLRRFIDIDYSLPLPEKGAFCRAQFVRYGLDEFFKTRQLGQTQYDKKQFEEVFSELFLSQGCSLREQERCFTLLSLAIRSTPENHLLFPLLLGVLILIKIKNHELYRGFVCGHKTYHDVLEYISSTAMGKQFLETNYGMVLEVYLAICRVRRHETDELILAYQQTVDDSSTNTKLKERAADIVRLLNSYEYRDHAGVLDYLVEKIDLVSHFKR